MRAIRALDERALTPTFLATLAHHLADPDFEVIERATVSIKWLCEYGNGLKPTSLVVLAHHPADSKGRIYKSAVDPVKELVRPTSPPTILMALTTLLIDRQVRRSAANAICSLGATAATPTFLAHLAKLLVNLETEVCRNAINIVPTLGKHAATREILAALSFLLADPDDDVRESATWAVGYLGVAATTPSFLAALAKLLADPAARVRESAAKAVKNLGAAAATPATLTRLITALDSDGDDRRTKVELLTTWTREGLRIRRSADGALELHWIGRGPAATGAR
jgi:HEAT repeat protein